MNCAEFEGRLAALLGNEIDPGERIESLLALRSHAEGCRECRGARDLIEVAGGRIGFEEPLPERYWDGFRQRLRARIAEERSTSRSVRGWSAVAALLLVVAVGSWAVRRGAVPTTDPATVDATEWPVELDELLSRIPPDEALRQLEFLPETLAGESDGLSDGDWIYPDTGGLDDDGRRELLEWLREENQTDRRTRS